MATKLASGFIELSVRYGDAQKQITKDFLGLENQAKRSGKKAGQESAKSFSGALRSGINQASFTGVFSRFQADAKKSGNTAGFVAGRAMGAGVTAGLTAATAGLGAIVGGIGVTLFKGFERYKSLDATAKRLGAMGKTVEQVQAIVADINEVVEGTPIALDAASKAATQFLEGGVKEGEELKEVLTAIADSAGSSGANFDDLAIIFGQVMNKGKLQAEEMMQLNERGIGIQAMLRKEFGWTGEELEKLTRDGQINLSHLVQAVEGNVGGMAKKAGDSVEGALSNMQAAVAKTGSNFLAAIFGDPLSTTEGGPGGMAQAIGNVTEKINQLNAWVVANKDGIKQFFTDAANAAKSVVDAVINVSTFLKEHPGLIQGVVVAFAAWKTIQGVTALITGLKTVSTLLGVTIPASAATGAAATATSWAPVFAAFKLLPLAGVGLGGVKDSADLGLPQVQTNPDGSLSLGPMAPGSLGGGPNAQRQRRGLGPIDPTGGLLMPGGGGGPGGPVGNMPSGLISSSSGQGGLTTSTVDGIASQFGLTKSSGLRPGDSGYHGSGQAGDYAGPPAAMQRFAAYMQQSYGSGLLELIYDAPGWGGNVKNGQVTGPFGNVYTMDQAGDHTDHVHVAVKTYDQGGIWPTDTLGINTTGKDEYVLTPEEIEELKKQGVDPASVQHGMGQGAPPGPSPEKLAQLTGMPGSGPTPGQLNGQPQGGDGAELMGGSRTEGYIPAGAGSTAVAGTSFLSGIYGMGAEVINGMIDQAASVASSAVGMAASAFAPGSGGAAAGAAQAGIGMATGAIKRGVEYGAQMLGIGTDALIEQLTPFGAPRLLTTDPTGFMPQQLLSGAIGKMMQPGGQGMPGMPGQPPAPGMTPPPGVATDHPGTGAAPGVPNPPGPPPGVVQTVGQAQPDPNQMTALDFLKPIVPTVHDQGGWLPPGGLAMNLTKRAEPMPVFNHDQWGTLNSIANNPVSEPAMAGGGSNDYRMVFEAGSITVKDVAEFERAMRDRQSMQSMRYRGRPG